MTDTNSGGYVVLAEGTGVVRKVQWAAVFAALASQLATTLSYPLAQVIVNAVPAWQSEAGFFALSTLVELLLVGAGAGGGALAAGYYTRARPADLIAQESTS